MAAAGWINPELFDPVPGEAVQSDMAPIELRGADLSVGRTDGTAQAKPDLPRHLAQQVADVARMMPDRPVELTLSPDELGRLRLTFNMDGGAMSVAVNVERPETLDLMRRHIETLAQELRDLGYGDVSFDFSQNTGDQNARDGDLSEEDHSVLRHGDRPSGEVDPDPNAPVRLSLDASGGVDIRM